MKSRYFSLSNSITWAVITLLVVTLLSACAAPGSAPALPSEAPAVAPATPTSAAAPTAAATPTAAPQTDPPEPGPRSIPVADVQVQIGQGSPIPVDIVVSGEWPDLCAQLAVVEPRFVGARVEVALLATPADPSCPPDHVGLPFRMLIPLNMAELPQGSYAVAVNGIETSFDWVSAGDGVLPAVKPGAELRPIPVSDVQVEVGVGSPIPVEAVVSGDWPDPCAQVARIDQLVAAGQFEISLLATAADGNCPPDRLGLPFRIAIPLNMVEMPLGETRVIVNGVATSFDWQAVPGAMEPTPVSSAAPVSGRIAYIGVDGNLWVMDQPGEAPRQLTTDGTSVISTGSQAGEQVSYYFPALSSDGALLAYRRDAGTPVASGLEYTFGLWVTDLNIGESRQVIDKIPAGFSWKPGTHLLTYGLGAAEGYFSVRGQPAPELASGIWAVDLDQGEPYELVRPERGFTLARPLWAPDASRLSFEEVVNMEGSGNFAVYDLAKQAYTPWEKPLGIVDWSPDGVQIAYDYMTYSATGTERVYLNSHAGDAEQQFSPDPEQGYAWYPVFSPRGDRLAYITHEGSLDDTTNTLVVQDLAGGEQQKLGTFESILDLEWSPDGKSLVFSAGPFEARQVIAVDVADGSSAVLAPGSDPALATP